VNELETITQGREPDAMWRPTGAIDPVRLEALWSLSARIATAAIVPMSLRGKGIEGRDFAPFDAQTVAANVFAVVEQADRWGISPFSLLACSAIVHGRLGFEGKVINAVLESNYGVKLGWTFSGKEGSDDRFILIIGYDPKTGEILTNPDSKEALSVKGTVGQWKTTGNGSPWRAPDYDKMLVYRGAREWARLHKAAAILGINSIDELMAIDYEARAQVAEDRTASLSNRYKPESPARKGGFSPDHIKQIDDARDQVEVVGNVVETKEKEKVKVAPESQPETEEDKGQASGEETSTDTVDRLAPEIHTQYSGALIRVSKADALKKMAAEFWTGHGGWPPASADDLDLAKAVFAAHANRVDGKISIDDMKAYVAELIADSFGEGK